MVVKREKNGCIQASWLYSGKSGFNDQTGCIRAKVVVSGNVVIFGQKWLYSGKGGCIRVKVVVFGQKLLYSGKSG